MAGPLAGLRIIEFAGIGPGPFCAMMLADHGAEVIRIDRPGARSDARDALGRNRRSVVLDMKKPEALAIARTLCAGADAIVEGYRPGVMERLGLGPEVLLADNPDLVYGRMTGWGQYGPFADMAGHDLNYIALSGVLHTIGPAEDKPAVPVNYIGDFGGGAMMLAFGIVSALLAVKSGTARGQVIDAAMTDGSAMIAAMTYSFKAMGIWADARGTNILDGAAPFYDTYRCADGRDIAVGAIEPQFYALLREKTGLAADPDFDAQHDKARWPMQKQKLAAVFASKTRDVWAAIFDGSDACVAPILSLTEAPAHPHNVARGSFIELGGAIQPAPAPRYSVTQSGEPNAAPDVGADSAIILGELGFSDQECAQMKEAGIFY